MLGAQGAGARQQKGQGSKGWPQPQRPCLPSRPWFPSWLPAPPSQWLPQLKTGHLCALHACGWYPWEPLEQPQPPGCSPRPYLPFAKLSLSRDVTEFAKVSPPHPPPHAQPPGARRGLYCKHPGYHGQACLKAFGGFCVWNRGPFHPAAGFRAMRAHTSLSLRGLHGGGVGAESMLGIHLTVK